MTIQSRVRPSRSDTYWVEASKKSWRIPARAGAGHEVRLRGRLADPGAADEPEGGAEVGVDLLEAEGHVPQVVRVVELAAPGVALPARRLVVRDERVEVEAQVLPAAEARTWRGARRRRRACCSPAPERVAVGEEAPHERLPEEVAADAGGEQVLAIEVEVVPSARLHVEEAHVPRARRGPRP